MKQSENIDNKINNNNLSQEELAKIDRKAKFDSIFKESTEDESLQTEFLKNNLEDGSLEPTPEILDSRLNDLMETYTNPENSKTEAENELILNEIKDIQKKLGVTVEGEQNEVNENIERQKENTGETIDQTKEETVEQSKEKIEEEPGLKAGDMVHWEIGGVEMWAQPKKIVSIEIDPETSDKYALIEGQKTGVLLEQLSPVEETVDESQQNENLANHETTNQNIELTKSSLDTERKYQELERTETEGTIFDNFILKMNQSVKLIFENRKLFSQYKKLEESEKEIKEINETLDLLKNQKETEIKKYDETISGLKVEIMKKVFIKNRDKKAEQFDKKINKIEDKLRLAQNKYDKIMSQRDKKIEQVKSTVENHNRKVDLLVNQKKEKYKYESLLEKQRQSEAKLEQVKNSLEAIDATGREIDGLINSNLLDRTSRKDVKKQLKIFEGKIKRKNIQLNTLQKNVQNNQKLIDTINSKIDSIRNLGIDIQEKD